MKRKILSVILIFAMTLSLIPVNITSSEVKAASANRRVVGYLPSYRSYDSIDWSAMTHCILSFMTYSGGTLTSGFSDAATADIVGRCHANGAKCMIAIGGWNGFDTSDGPFTTAEKRTSFINQVMSYVDRNGLDGVDLDLEVNDDGVWSNFDAFVSELSGRLKAEGKLLTMAVSTWFTGSIQNSTYNYFDFINLMSYDANTQGTGENAPWSQVYDMVAYYSQRGVSNDRMTIGVPFYGYGAGGTAYTYSQILGMDYNAAKHSDVCNGIYYNGEDTIRQKAEYSKSYGGTMIWEIGQDASGSDSLLGVIKQVMAEGAETPTQAPTQAPTQPQEPQTTQNPNAKPEDLTYTTITCDGTSGVTLDYAIQATTIEGLTPWYGDGGNTFQFAYSADAGKVLEVTVNGQEAAEGVVVEKGNALVKINPTKLTANAYSTIHVKTVNGEFTFVIKKGASTDIPTTKPSTEGNETTPIVTENKTTKPSETGGNSGELTYTTINCQGKEELTLNYAIQSTTVEGLTPWYGDGGNTFQFAYSADAGKVLEVTVNEQTPADGVVVEKGNALVKINPTKLAANTNSVINVKTANGEFTFVIKTGAAPELPTTEPATTKAPLGSIDDLDPKKLTYDTIACEENPELVLEYAIPSEYATVTGIETWYGDAGTTFMLKYAAVAGEVSAVKINGEPAIDGIVKEKIAGMVKIDPTKLVNDAYSIITVVTATGEFTTVIKKGNAEDIISPTEPIETSKSSGESETTKSQQNPSGEVKPEELTYTTIECDDTADLTLEYAIPFTSIEGITPWYGDAGTTFNLQFDSKAGNISEITLNGTAIETTGGIVKQVLPGMVKIDPTKLADNAYSIIVIKAEVGEFTLVVKRGDAKDIISPSTKEDGDDETTKSPQGPDTEFDPTALTYESVECEGNSDLVLDWAVPFATIEGILPWYGDAGTTLMIKFSADAGKVSEVVVNGTSVGTTGGVVKEKGEGFVKVDPTRLPDDAYSVVVVKAENGELTFVIKKGDATELATPGETSEGATTDAEGNLPGPGLENLNYETVECVDKAGLTIDYYILKEFTGLVEPWYGDNGSTLQFKFSADSGKILEITVNDEPAANGVVTEQMPGSVKINPSKLQNNAYSVIKVTAENGDFAFVIKRGDPSIQPTTEATTEEPDETTITDVTTSDETTTPAITETPTTRPIATRPITTTPTTTRPLATRPITTTKTPSATTPAATVPTTNATGTIVTPATTAAPANVTTVAKVSVAKVQIKKVTKKLASKKAKISLKKISGAKYEVKVSTTKKFKKKNTVVKKVKKVTFTVSSKKIVGKQVIYVRARAYKIVSGKTYYGKWSKIKKVKIKK